ncbi:hypothetical protein HMSSN036_28120 [Paenibacillus macerans]|nr:hypothetical protein HMSSN036_28120 [Paenibacillus macerans]
MVEVYDAVNQLLGEAPNPNSESAAVASEVKPKEKRKLGSVILELTYLAVHIHRLISYNQLA